MGCFDGAEKCNLVGLYLLSLLIQLGITVGLFRDDGAAVTTLPPKEAEKLKSKIVKIFKAEGLDITIQANLKSIEFLDAEVDLTTGIHRAFSKPNNNILYIDVKSNHPQCVIKNTPLAVQKRLSMLSSNEEVFNQTAPPYQAALEKAGHRHMLKFEKPTTSKRSNNRRKITWYNPPFSQNVETNIGATFLKLIDTCFPPGHRLQPTINRHTVKISYRTMPNMANVISRHNTHTVKQQQPPTQEEARTCSCSKAVKDSGTCPMAGQCLLDNIIYQATVTREDTGQAETYTGLTSTTWKERRGVHNHSFKHKAKPGAKSSNSTALSTYIWKLKDSKIEYSLSWKILARANPFNTSSKMCRLCLTEKYFLMFNQEGATLNSRSEFYSACRHKTGMLLSNT